MSVEALAQIDPSRFFSFQAPGSAGRQQLTTQTSELAVSHDLSGRLSVLTAEGDRITLTADFETDFRTRDVRAQGIAERTLSTVDATYAEFTFRNELSLAVEGNLNEQELQDVESLFSKITNVFRGFIQGKDEGGLSEIGNVAHHFSHLSSLADIDLSLDLERSVTQLATYISSELAGHQAAESSRLIPSAGSAILTASVPGLNVDEGTWPHLQANDFHKPVSLFQQILDILKESHLEPRKIHEHLPSLFARLREERGEEQRGEHKQKNVKQEESAKPVHPSSVMSAAVALAYGSVRESSFSLSLQS